MEIPLQTPINVFCRQSENAHLNFRSFSGLFSYKPSRRRSSHSFSWHIEYPGNGGFRPFSAAADFSRKKSKRWSTARSKGPAPKGFVPKAPVGTSSQKKDQRSDEDTGTSVTPAPERAPDVGLSRSDDTEGLEVSQVNRIQEQKEDATNGKAGESSPANKAVVASKNLLKESEGVRGFIGEGQSCSSAGLEPANSELHLGDSIVSGSEVLQSEIKSFETAANAEKEAEDLEVIGEDPTAVSNKRLKEIESVRNFIQQRKSSSSTVYQKSGEVADLELQQRSPTATGIEVFGSGSRGSVTATTNEIETDDLSTRVSESKTSEEEDVGDVNIVQEDPIMLSYQSTESDNSGAETALLVPESKASDTYQKKPKDLVSVEETLSVVNYQNTESEKNVSKIRIAASDMNTDMTIYEKEGEDLLQVNLPSSDENVTGQEQLKSELRVTVTSDEKDLEETLRKLEMEMEALRIMELERKEQERKLELERKEQEQKLELERKEQERKLELEREAAMRKQAREELAEMNFSKGNKLFIYPETVKPDQDIEVFLNRSLSALKDEPDVIIMGAFNDWRWKSFTINLEKTHLNGDWWSCRMHVPREAYILDFVFFNGKDVYENNDRKDFHISVEGGMDLFSFEEYLLEEKRRELEELAKAQAERERLAEEQRRREEEKAASEADRTQAKVEVKQRQEKLSALIKNALSAMENVWYFEPREFQDGDLVRLYYNKSSGPLAQANEVWLHGGHNGWGYGISVVSRLVKSEAEGADWWYAEVTVPNLAIVLDWVFADGPPEKASAYDNNRRQDFHAVVPKNIPDDRFWIEEEQRIYDKLQEERRLKEEARRAKAEKTARMKAETKERTLKTFLLSQRDIVYTDPVDVRAGQDVTVYYNPSNTVLNGKPEVWFRGSFNRWTHRRGPLPPQKMLPVENSSHVKTSVKVPLDAYMMDFVFSERQDGGIFDNKNKMDYHVPVFGGVAKEPPMHIVHIAVEMAPIAKVGGLGDVVTSLSRAVQELNHHVDIVFPKYDCLNLSQVKDFHYQKSYSWGGTEIKVWFGKVEGLSVYFLEPLNGLFQTGSVYIGKSDGDRFGFFCHAALEFLLQSGFHPDIIHCHDWTSAPVAWLYKEHYGQYGLTNARVVFTIHNLEFGAYFIGRAMAYADKATTVSNTYSKEVAGNSAIAPHLYKFHGILNGIDPDIWDPYNDSFIPVNYTSENVDEGKRAAKEALQQRLSLKKGDLPVVGIITRLTHQKGIHLIKHAIWRTIERGGQVVLLGSAPDPRIQQEFVDLGNQLHNMHHDRARLCLTYDEPLSHLIYAGADFILVPSIFEPCGLTQLVAMRYGSIPVVRKTGGLYDTVFDVDHDVERAKGQGLEPNGFNFEGADQAGVDYALNRAISSWYDAKEWFRSLRKRVMEQDWSWNRPALEYMELYHAARKY